MTPIVSLKSVSVDLKTVDGMLPILNDVSFDIERGETVGLVGESGSGKTITARSIIGLLPVGASVRGELWLTGTNVLTASRRQLRQLRATSIGMIFQDPRAHIDPLWRSGDHVTETLRVHRSMSRALSRRRALELLTAVGIGDPERVFNAYPFELSGGLLQRVMIAGALATEPQLLIADEPTTALDVTVQAEIVALLSELRQTHNLAVLFITHDLELAGAICDRTLVMYGGRVVEEQPTDSLFAHPSHPYTAALLRARPTLDQRVSRLAVIPGRPPQPDELPEGCVFHPRCPYCEPACVEERPALRTLAPGRTTRCRRAEELLDEVEHETGAVRASLGEGVHNDG